MLTRYVYGEDGKPHKQGFLYTANEHGIKRNQIDSDALRVIDRLNAFGFKAYIVGGAVRDLLLKKQPKDFDIVTDATPSKIKKIFHNSRIIGRRFRLVHVFFGEKIFEVSTFRSSANGSVGNVFGTMEEDVKRRDFTLNALYYDCSKEQVVDYVGGVKDVKNNCLREVIPLERIFVEDPVRMIRGVKYSSANGFKIPHYLKHRIKKDAELLKPISPSRLTEEIIKILNTGKASVILPKIYDFGLFSSLQPQADKKLSESKSFREAYVKSIEELDSLVLKGDSVSLGKKLVALIDAYVDTLKIPTELIEADYYNFIYNECRHFILPINPPRTELEVAVAFCLKKRNVPFKMPKRTRRRGKQTSSIVDLQEKKEEVLEATQKKDSQHFKDGHLEEKKSDKKRSTRKKRYYYSKVNSSKQKSSASISSKSNAQ